MTTCTFCETEVEDTEVGAIDSDGAVACNGCYDVGEPADRASAGMPLDGAR